MNAESFSKARQAALLIVMLFSCSPAYGMDNYPYSGECKKLGFSNLSPESEDAAEGIAVRKGFVKTGMALHKNGKWEKSNCYLIHAINISADHAVNIINTIGYNFAALGKHEKALEYFKMGTGYTFDLEGWVRKKRTKPFDKVLSNPVYKEYENSLYAYYRAMGLDIPK